MVHCTFCTNSAEPRDVVQCKGLKVDAVQCKSGCSTFCHQVGAKILKICSKPVIRSPSIWRSLSGSNPCSALSAVQPLNSAVQPQFFTVQGSAGQFLH